MQLTHHRKAIEYACLIPRDQNWDSDFPGQDAVELDIISHGRGLARLRQSKDKSWADKSTEKKTQVQPLPPKLFH